MPRVLHHVMVRGLERRVIFREDRDRADFVTRLTLWPKRGLDGLRLDAAP